MISHDPLHRSGRAALPHPAPALGGDGEAGERVGVTDTCGWKPPVDEATHPVPGGGSGLAAAVESLPSQTTDRLAEASMAGPFMGTPW